MKSGVKLAENAAVSFFSTVAQTSFSLALASASVNGAAFVSAALLVLAVVVASLLVGGAAHAPRINAVRINRRVLFIGSGLLKKIKKASAFYAKPIG
jgi:hypothetical protein